jgi:hypothetical protein
VFKVVMPYMAKSQKRNWQQTTFFIYLKIAPHATISETATIENMIGLKPLQWKHIDNEQSRTSKLASMVTWLTVTQNSFYFVP